MNKFWLTYKFSIKFVISSVPRPRDVSRNRQIWNSGLHKQFSIRSAAASLLELTAQLKRFVTSSIRNAVENVSFGRRRLAAGEARSEQTPTSVAKALAKAAVTPSEPTKGCERWSLFYDFVIQKEEARRLKNLLIGNLLSLWRFIAPLRFTLNDVWRYTGMTNNRKITNPKNPELSIIHYALLILLTLSSVEGFSQAVSINPTGASPDPSAMLDVNDTTKGFLPPRMSTNNMNAISSPAAGLFIYNTDSAGYYYYNGSNWISFGSGTSTAFDTLDENVFGAKVENNAGTVTLISQSADFIQSVQNPGGTGWVRVNFKSGFFAEPPAAVASSTNINVNASVTSPTSSSVTIRTSDNSGTYVNTDVSLVLIRQGADYRYNTNQTTPQGPVLASQLPSEVVDSSRIADSDNGTRVSVQDESNIIFSTGGSESARINASGYFGIGNSNPGTWLDMNVASSNTGLQIRGDFEPGIKLDAYGANGEAWEIFSASGATAEGQGNLVFYNRTNAQSRMVIDTNGNVGIGTSDPLNLGGHSDNKVGISAAIGSARLTLHEQTDDNHLTIGVHGNGLAGDAFLFGSKGIQFGTKGFDRVKIDSNGYVGIGTTGPTSLLTIGDGTTQTRITLNGSLSANKGLVFQANSAQQGHILMVSNNMFINRKADLRFRDAGGGITHMIIDSTGHVGVGTSSPESKLHIQGQDNAGTTTGITLRSTATTKASRIHFDKASDGETVIGPSHNLGTILARGYDGTNYQSAANIIFSADGTINTDDVPGRIEFSTRPLGGTTTVERMRIDNAGNVGIGTTSPTYTLHVKGRFEAEIADTTTQQTALSLNNGLTNSNGLLFKYTFNAIGDVPAETWQVRSTGSGAKDIAFTRFDSKTILFLDMTDDRIGVGTTAPNKDLDVAGTFGFSGVEILPTASGNFDLDVSAGSHFERNAVSPPLNTPVLNKLIGGQTGQIITITFTVDGANLRIRNNSTTGTGDPIFIDGLAQDALQTYTGYQAIILVKGANGWYIVN